MTLGRSPDQGEGPAPHRKRVASVELKGLINPQRAAGGEYSREALSPASSRLSHGDIADRSSHPLADPCVHDAKWGIDADREMVYVFP